MVISRKIIRYISIGGQKTLRDKNYRFKFIDLKEIDFMKSELWKHLSKL